MRNLLKYALLLLVSSIAVRAAAQQQMTFTLADMYRVNASQWRYGTVTCASSNSVTSVILSMINNNIVNNSSGINPVRTVTSLGVNPRTVLYLFTPAITPTQVGEFVKGMTFSQTNEVPSANPYVNITVDANPTRLPDGATITVWDKHPDGSPHYYVWVPHASVYYETAYNNAKTYYFQGMRGYMPTITTLDENRLLTNISAQEGWSGGARTPDNTDDKRTITRPTRNNSTGANYKWLCGPETGFFYHSGPTYSQGGAMGGAFAAWNNAEPNDSGSSENVMQVNYTAALLWNDYAPTNGAIRGYFIEFGGNGEAYSVGAANYPANPKYHLPTVETTNDQWEGFSPGNRASTSTTFKPNAMRANVLVIE